MNILKRITVLAVLATAGCGSCIAGQVEYVNSERTTVIIDNDLKLVCVKMYPNSTTQNMSGCWTFSQVMKDQTLDAIVRQAKKQLEKGEAE